MTLAINDTAPDFEAQTTEGKIRAFLAPEGFHAGMHH